MYISYVSSYLLLSHPLPSTTANTNGQRYGETATKNGNYGAHFVTKKMSYLISQLYLEKNKQKQFSNKRESIKFLECYCNTQAVGQNDIGTCVFPGQIWPK